MMRGDGIIWGGGGAGWMEKRGVGGGGLRLGFTGRTPRRVQLSLDLCFSLLSIFCWQYFTAVGQFMQAI